MKITAVLAMSEKRLIGKNGGLPWHIAEDMKHFQRITKWWIVIMGRATYESLPQRYKPLPGRRNIVLSRNDFPDCESYTSIPELLEVLEEEKQEQAFIIGWSQIYHEFFQRELTDTVECTLVSWDYDGDTYIPEWRENFELSKNIPFSEWFFQTYTKI